MMNVIQEKSLGQIDHEELSYIKETRIDVGVKNFEVFKMRKDENIDET